MSPHVVDVNVNHHLVNHQIAWALNKGIKPDLKPLWDVELGVTYIPWAKIREDQLEDIQEGGMLDVDTLSPGEQRRALQL